MDTMKKKKSRLEDASSSAVRRRWGEMDHSILTQILKNIWVGQLSSNVSWVCRSWQFACWEVLFWKHSSTLDMQQFEVFSDILGPLPPPAGVDEYSKMEIKAMKLIKSIFEGDQACGTPVKGWSQSLRNVLFPQDFHISDRILLYIAERTPGLSMIYLTSSNRITGSSFTMAITHWNRLKFLIIGPIDGGFNTDVIRELGRHCKNLEHLHIHVNEFTLDEDSATAMATNLLNLKFVAFLRCSIRKSGVEVVAKQFRELEYVVIEYCVLLVEEIGLSLTMVRAPRASDFQQWSSKKLQFRVISNR